MTALRARGGDPDPDPCRGSALVEFVWLALLLMIPLVYVVLSAVAVQRDAFGLTAAARDAARAYATAGSDGLGEQRAEEAVEIAMHDQGAAWQPTGRVVQCGACTYAPGSSFTVVLGSRVALPLVPSWLCGHTCVAGIGVSARHTERIGCYAGTGPPDPGLAVLSRPGGAAPDEGQITVLVIGYVTIALVLIVAGIDASKVFLAQRALSSAADAAALAAAQGVDTRALYDGRGIRCGTTLPLDPGRASTLAAVALDDEAEDLRGTFSGLSTPETDVVAGDVSVRLSGEVSVPFGKVLGWLDPSYPDGRVPVTEIAHATSPVAGGGC